MNIQDLESARRKSAEIRESGNARLEKYDPGIVKVTMYLDAHYPCRSVVSLFALEYRYSGELTTHYLMLGAGDVRKKAKGFLVSHPIRNRNGSITPYGTMSYPVNGDLIISPLCHAPDSVPIIGAMRMAQLVVSSRHFPQVPVIPFRRQIAACRALRLSVHEIHKDGTGTECAYSGSVAGGHYVKPGPCPRCNHPEVKEFGQPTEDDPLLTSDAAYSILRREGVIWW